MHSAIIYSTSCLSVTTMKEKMFLPQEPKEDAGMIQRRKGEKLGVNPSALLSPRKGWHILNYTSGKPEVRNKDLVSLNCHLYFLWSDTAGMLMHTGLMLTILGLIIDLLAFSIPAWPCQS